MPILIFSLILILIIVILFLSMMLFYKDKKSAPVSIKPTQKSRYKSLDECTIEELADRIAKEKLSENELLNIVSLVAKNHKFPGRNSGKSPEHYLRFIFQFCLNSNAGGATIVKMSNTLKAVNSEYKNDIETTERNAVRERDIGS